MTQVDNSLDLENQFNIMYIQSALSTDSGTNTRALQHTVSSPDEVSGHFTGISYSKGATVLMMLKHFLTPNTFQKALRMFLTDRYVFVLFMLRASISGFSETKVFLFTKLMHHHCFYLWKWANYFENCTVTRII